MTHHSARVSPAGGVRLQDVSQAPPTSLASPIDKDRGDYTLFSGEWAMGRIYEERGARKELHWFSVAPWHSR